MSDLQGTADLHQVWHSRATQSTLHFACLDPKSVVHRRHGGYVAQKLETPYQGCCLPWDEGCTVRDSKVASRSRKKAAYAVPARRVVGFATAAPTGMQRPTEHQQDDPVPPIIRSAYAGLL